MSSNASRGRRRWKSGFTLIELLVVIAIIAMLVAILLPAVQQAREAARMSTCKNNLKQIGIALHNYHDVHNAFPIGFIDSGLPNNPTTMDGGWTWAAQLLPQLEQGALYDQFNFSYFPHGDNSTIAQVRANSALCATTQPVFTCPTDVKEPHKSQHGAASAHYIAKMATSSYAGVIGSFDADACLLSGNNVIQSPRVNGAFTTNQSRRFRDFTDGTSNAIVVGEINWLTSENAMLYGGVTTGGGANCANDGVNTASPWHMMRASRQKINYPQITGTAFHKTFGSLHRGGAQFLLGDGAVRFISESIEHTNTNYTPANPNLSGPFGLYQRLAAISDGQTLGEF